MLWSTDNHSLHCAQSSFFQASLCSWMPACEMPLQATCQEWAMRRASQGGYAPGEGCTPGELTRNHLTAQGPSRRPRTSPLLFALPCPVVHGCDAGPWLAALVEQLGHRSREGACSSRADEHCGRGAWRRPLTGKCQTWHTGLADRWPWPNQAPTGVCRKPSWASPEHKGSSHCPVPQTKAWPPRGWAKPHAFTISRVQTRAEGNRVPTHEGWSRPGTS